MKRLAPCAALLWLASSLASAQGLGNVLEDLTRLRQDTRSRRVSSFDTTGGNNDRLEKSPPGSAAIWRASRAPASSITSGSRSRRRRRR